MRTCEACGAAFMGEVEGPCPACGDGSLLEAEAPEEAPAPELCLPFLAELSQTQLGRWAKGVRFRTRELDPALLARRARPVWLPMWLLDIEASGTWSAEVGFDYEVESAREQLSGGSWKSTSIRETRIRWEPRQGSLRRSPENLVAPALALHGALWERLGGYALDQAEPAPPEVDGLLRLPDLPPTTAWPAAEAALHARLAEDCQEAAGAAHIREPSFHLETARPHWTLLLLPVWATWYADDQGRSWTVLINGRSGVVSGPRWASPRKGLLWALVLGGLSLACLLFTLVVGLGALVLPVLLVLALLTGGLFLLFAGLALWPLLAPRHHNRRERARVLPGATGSGTLSR